MMAVRPRTMIPAATVKRMILLEEKVLATSLESDVCGAPGVCEDMGPKVPPARHRWCGSGTSDYFTIHSSTQARRAKVDNVEAA
jgi:hypothetical protein